MDIEIVDNRQIETIMIDVICHRIGIKEAIGWLRYVRARQYEDIAENNNQYAFHHENSVCESENK